MATGADPLAVPPDTKLNVTAEGAATTVSDSKRVAVSVTLETLELLCDSKARGVEVSNRMATRNGVALDFPVVKFMHSSQTSQEGERSGLS